MALIPGLGRSPGEGNSYPLQHSCLENPNGQRSLAGYSRRDCNKVYNHMLPVCPSLPPFPHLVTINLISMPVSVLQIDSYAYFNLYNANSICIILPISDIIYLSLSDSLHLV